jgi:ribosomal protein S18 acetylase RimI-like enzyme
LGTGDSGEDASERHHCPDLLGEVFVGPYLYCAPQHAFVLVDEADGCVGYVLGVADTRAFESRLESDWWPPARIRAQECRDPLPADGWLLSRLALPVTAPEEIVELYPAHGHIDLLPIAQGSGWGARMMTVLMDSLADAGAPGMHLEVSPANARALAFYDKLGFAVVATGDDALYLGRRLG